MKLKQVTWVEGTACPGRSLSRAHGRMEEEYRLGGWENFLRLDWWKAGLHERGQRTRQMSLKIQEAEQVLGKEGNGKLSLKCS